MGLWEAYGKHMETMGQLWENYEATMEKTTMGKLYGEIIYGKTICGKNDEHFDMVI